MCTVVLSIHPGSAWPIVLAANRDERLDRVWDGPAFHWPDRPNVFGGRDRTAGGTWMATNGRGVVAAVLNRPGSLGPAPGKRSRGELPLLALEHDSAERAAAYLGEMDARAWRAFNMVVADRSGAFFIRGLGHGRPQGRAMDPGIRMVTAHDPDDPDSPRVARHLTRFRAASPPRPDRWEEWRAILADQSGSPGEQINVTPRGGFGTVSSSFLALPAAGDPVWLFAAGPPHEVPFLPVGAGM